MLGQIFEITVHSCCCFSLAHQLAYLKQAHLTFMQAPQGGLVVEGDVLVAKFRVLNFAINLFNFSLA